MTPKRFDRRLVLQGTAALGAASALAALAAPELGQAGGGPGPSVLGTWLETITSPDHAFPAFQTLTTYAGGGGLVSTASIDLNPATLGSGAFGAWVRTGERSFRWFAHAFSYTPQGAPNGLFNIRESVTLDGTGDAYSGSGSFEIVNNGTVLFSATVRVAATRVTV